ncbi:DNA polymerase III subunit epsilon [Francisella noatunensis]|uniref:DNA polymerase III subunit epsilon n=1 Tax=Francisella noatunensis TaxID=657445 RepID=A0A9Q2KVS4_9GAMM|nr:MULTISPECIES: DNA polymerase III subunit epsilon [Francisella]AJI55184.1 DNA polymerase III, epsilon subunit [Francisella philomiragia]AJI57449.1 DNA polymerase III, epsilon subunit [Francisella philomiragia]AJI74179.1 DNA polymerase III, epsilon subunit [Francisella philomiragia subsp. philomiragia ATCC 25015]EET21385.1 DNA polymerase III [Francisella philomiragia subsp. philomiragia ATCC 25015]MBK2028713.1 DNA polymerase III subunit epsilon [Francisella noatunensis]
MSRQVFIDTETTGFDYKIGNRIIEFGAVEVIDRKVTGNNLHFYCNPNYEVEAGALAVHGLTNEFLADKPSFEENVDQMIDFLRGAEIIIHNAAFDVPFINWELGLLKNNKYGTLEQHVAKIVDSLELARKKHPLQKNNLDALCKRYHIRNDHRTFHGALLDSELLADVYLAMTGGQTNLVLQTTKNASKDTIDIDFDKLKLRSANETIINISEHDKYLCNILKLEESAKW